MLVMGTFEHSVELEQFLIVMESGGISRQRILVISMDTTPSTLQFLGSQPDRYSRGIETGMVFATGGSVIGTSIGFTLAWGPIFWGIAAAAFGFVVGFGLYRLTRKGKHSHPEKLPEVTVIIQCPEDQSTLIADAMWQYRALSVGSAYEPVNNTIRGEFTL